MLTAGAIAATCGARLREPATEPVLLREFQLELVPEELVLEERLVAVPVLGLARGKP